MRIVKCLIALFAGVAMAACAQPQRRPGSYEGPDPPIVSSGVRFTLETFVDGLEHPWSITFLPADEGILLTERPGRLRMIRNGQLDPAPVTGLPEVAAIGQGGLLDLALHPNFTENRLIYFSYAKPGAAGATTAVGRGRFHDGRLSDVEDVFVAEAWGRGGRHFGSRLLFHGGYLYITVGDRGQMSRAQDLSDHAGTTVRLHYDGSIPEDNPFVGNANVRDEIYTYGNRNAQGMRAHPETGEIWQSEHGPRGGDEINIVVAGANYGWPEYRFANHYDGRRIPNYDPDLDIEIPIMDWTPAIAPGGIVFYTGEAYPEWRGDLFVASLVQRHLHRVRFEGSNAIEKERLLEDLESRIRDVEMGPDGLLYVLEDAPNGALLRLRPAG